MTGKAVIEIAGRTWSVRLDRPIDCARTLAFDAGDRTLFGAPPAHRAAYRSGSFVGSVALGGSVNVDEVTIVPHCHGTHTESAGHLTPVPMPLSDVWRPGPFAATLATVRAETGPGGQVEAGPAWETDDRVVTSGAVRRLLDLAVPGFLEAVVLRVAGDGPADAGAPPVETYLSARAALMLREAGVMHLVLEGPSIDRSRDAGRLDAHRTWWAIGEDGLPSPDRRPATLTEWACIPFEAIDGPCLLDLHLPAWNSDAVPSRPVLYAVAPSTGP